MRFLIDDRSKDGQPCKKAKQENINFIFVDGTKKEEIVWIVELETLNDLLQLIKELSTDLQVSLNTYYENIDGIIFINSYMDW